MANEDTILNMYIKEISRIPLLSREEENELARKAAKGDIAARNKIVKSNLRFVVNVAKHYMNHGLDFVDLISEGNIGLMTAIDHFDVSKGYHFISYAVWWIRQSIMKAVYEKGRAIRLPLNKTGELVKIEKVRKSLSGSRSEAEEVEEIGSMLGMERKHVVEMLNLSRELVSLDAKVSSVDQSKSCLGDFIEDTRNVNPVDHVVELSMKEEIDSVLETLKPNEAKVIRMRFGLNGLKPMSLKEVGEKCNLTKERIRQIEKSAISSMQKTSRREKLSSFVA